MQSEDAVRNLDDLVAFIVARAKDAGLPLNGPEEIAYGIYWEPTMTFWSGYRRLHFYYDALDLNGKLVEIPSAMTLEVAELVPACDGQFTSTVQRGLFQTAGEAWAVVEQFLLHHHSVETLPDLNWRVDTLDHDKFIPHPPDTPTGANIAALFKHSKGVPARLPPPDEPDFSGWGRFKRWIGYR